MPRQTAAPRIGRLDQIGPQRVPLHIAQHGQQMIIRLDRERLEAALVERASSRRPMRRAPALGMRDRQPTHELRQVAIAARPKHEFALVLSRTKIPDRFVPPAESSGRVVAGSEPA
jgi:hypothetical protein